MAAHDVSIGMCFDRSFPSVEVVEFARRLDEGGVDQLWLIEDCFYTSAVPLAAAALTATERIDVGLGILPAVARNAAVTAMEIATLCDLAPGRVIPGIGHGVQDWMHQMGARPASPVTTLEEVISAVTRLLAGERVTMAGRHVTLTDVALERPPADPPRVLAGVRGPKSIAMAGRVAGGLVLAELAGPRYVRWTREQAGDPDPFHIAVFTSLCVAPDRAEAFARAAGFVAEVMQQPSVSLTMLPFYDEMAARLAADGEHGLATMPADWWAELGAIGTIDDALAHLHALADAGADSIALFPAPLLDVARGQVDQVLELRRRFNA